MASNNFFFWQEIFFSPEVKILKFLLYIRIRYLKICRFSYFYHENKPKFTCKKYSKNKNIGKEKMRILQWGLQIWNPHLKLRGVGHYRRDDISSFDRYLKK